MFFIFFTWSLPTHPVKYLRLSLYENFMEFTNTPYNNFFPVTRNKVLEQIIYTFTA